MTLREVALGAISRNEGTWLELCLEMVQGRVKRGAYVDSGSPDGSVAVALAWQAEVVVLDMQRPFTAARAGLLAQLHTAAQAPSLHSDAEATAAADWKTPQTAIENLIAQMWSETLSVDRGDTRDNYSDAGCTCDMCARRRFERRRVVSQRLHSPPLGRQPHRGGGPAGGHTGLLQEPHVGVLAEGILSHLESACVQCSAHAVSVAARAMQAETLAHSRLNVTRPGGYADGRVLGMLHQVPKYSGVLMPLDHAWRVLVVIVNYRTAKLVVACLRSLHRAALAQAQRPTYVWLVNPDTLVRRGALAASLNFMERHPRVGVAGGRLEDEGGRRWPYAFRFPSLWRETDDGLRLGIVSRWLARYRIVRCMGDEPAPMDCISGANFMLRTALIDAIGLMDERYFLYFEETDDCHQAQRAGWQCWYVPDARVLHIAGQSGGISSKLQAQRRLPVYWLESRRRYFVKNQGWWYAVLVVLAWILTFAADRLRKGVQRKQDFDSSWRLWDFIHNSALVKT